jgi:hypothetical protein
MPAPKYTATEALGTLRSLPPDIARGLAAAQSERDLHELVRQHPALGPALSQVQAAIVRYLGIPDLAHGPQIIGAHPELLTDAADKLLLLLSDAQPDHARRVAMWVCLEMLRRSRKEGIEAAFHDIL